MKPSGSIITLLVLGALACRADTSPPTSPQTVRDSALVHLGGSTAATETGGPPPDDSGDDSGAETVPPNILLIIADDLGVAASACYAVGSADAPQPTLEGLCARGVVFEQVWSYPVCSPTRAAVLTGRYGWRTGIGRALRPDMAPLPLDEVTLPEQLGAAGYATANIGKWHLGTDNQQDYPNQMGWGHYSGVIESHVEDYYGWHRVTDGLMEYITAYATTTHVDDALSWLNQQSSPWLLWMAFTAPHKPLHLPPPHLISDTTLTGESQDIQSRPVAYYQAMIEAMDTELGRLLDGIGPAALESTWIIYIGDNGTEDDLDQDDYPMGQSKFTLYQGGVHVPMVIVGPGLPPGRVTAPVHVVDLFATILDLAGVAPAEGVELDSVSLVPWLAAPEREPPPHDLLLSELFGIDLLPNQAGRAIRDDRYKLIEWFDGPSALYDLPADPQETRNLLDETLTSEAQAALEVLHSQLLDIAKKSPDQKY